MPAESKQAACPYCGAAMRTVVMTCDRCEVEVRGRFRQTQFARLPEEDQAFLEQYLQAGFSIKALAERSGMGYVAIRNRLDRLIATYEELHANEASKRAILDRLDQGDISPAEAAEALERL